MSRKPFILLVDDNPDGEAKSLVSPATLKLVDFKVVAPEDVTAVDLSKLDLLLVDFRLSEWNRGDSEHLLACNPLNGRAMAAVLREHISANDRRSTPSAVALITSQIEDAMRPLSADNREHIVASLYGLEWVFDKTSVDVGASIASLARAVVSLRRDKAEDSLSKLLGLKETELNKVTVDMLKEDVRRCRPPLHEIYGWEDGLALLRWFLHKILPYPTCLVDGHVVATRMGIPYSIFLELITGQSTLSKRLAKFSYSGPLMELAGPRWWKLGIEQLLWELTDGKSASSIEVQTAVLDALPRRLRQSGKLKKLPENPVVCYGEHFRPIDELVDVASATRIRPDDWPHFALQPWAKNDDLTKYPELNQVAMVSE